MKLQAVLLECVVFLFFTEVISANQDPNSNGIAEQIDDIKVSAFEKRRFRGIVLQNKMKAVLIQDEHTDTVAMSMFIAGGSSQSPVEVRGLSNLVQFVITEGNGKYPNAEDFRNFMNDVGGTWNGYTFPYKTGFYCSSPVDKFVDTLDRFSSLFYEPLFEQSRIDANIKIITEMYDANVEVEESRLDAVKIDTFQKDSKLANPSSGNTHTLKTIPEEKGLNVRDEVVKFFNDYYSSDKMFLAILGKGSLDELQKTVIDYFGGLKPNDIQPTYHKHGPLTEQQLKKKISVAALMDTYYMELDFAIPDPTFDYKSAPIVYMSYFVENKGVGSLYAYLHKIGLITDIWVSTKIYDRGAAVLEVRFDLTKFGLEQADTVIQHFFEYFAMVQQNGILETIYEEIKNIFSYKFEYSTDKSWFQLVYPTARDLVDFPIKDVLSKDIPQHFDKELLQNYMNCLRPDNMRIILRAKHFADIADITAEFSPVKYKIDDIPPEVIEGWKNAQPNVNFAMPLPNKCIPGKFDLLQVEKESHLPEIIKDTDLMRLWHYQDPVFRLPLNYLGVYLRSPKFIESAKNSVLVEFFVSLFSDAMVEQTYDAIYAGYTFSVYSAGDRITLYFDGYSDKFTVLVGIIFGFVKKFEFTHEIFELKKDEIKRNIENWKSYDSYQLSNYYMHLSMSSRAYTGDELLFALQEITMDDAKKFNSEILNQIFVEAFLYGNCDTNYANEISGIIEPYTADSIAYQFKDLIYSDEIILKEGGKFVYPIQAATSTNYAITAYYQCNPLLSHWDLALIELFNLVSENSYQDAIRVQEQISYMFFKLVREGDAVMGLYMPIQSEFENSKLDEILEKYLVTLESILQKLTDEELGTYKESLKYTLLKKLDTMYQQYFEFASAITTVTYDFTKYKSEAAKVDEITKDNLIEFYSTYLKADSAKRTKLLVYVIPTGKSDTYAPPEGATIIGDIWEFRKSQDQSAPPKQHGDYPPIGVDG